MDEKQAEGHDVTSDGWTWIKKHLLTNLSKAVKEKFISKAKNLTQALARRQMGPRDPVQRSSYTRWIVSGLITELLKLRPEFTAVDSQCMQIHAQQTNQDD